jgi:hypothetical protein
MARLGDQALTYRRDLLRRLTEAENYLGEDVSQAAMVVDLGEIEVFVRQMPQLIDGAVDAQGAVGDRFEQRFQLLVNSALLRD